MYDEPESPHEGDVFKQKQKPFGLSEPVIKTLCLQMGGGAAPPQTPRFLFTPCRLALKNIVPSTRTVSSK